MKKVMFSVKTNDKSANPGMKIMFCPQEFKAFDKVDLSTLECEFPTKVYALTSKNKDGSINHNMFSLDKEMIELLSDNEELFVKEYDLL